MNGDPTVQNKIKNRENIIYKLVSNIELIEKEKEVIDKIIKRMGKTNG